MTTLIDDYPRGFVSLNLLSIYFDSRPISCPSYSGKRSTDDDSFQSVSSEDSHAARERKNYQQMLSGFTGDVH